MKSWWRAVAGYPPSWVAIAIVVLAMLAILLLLEPSTLFTLPVLGVGIAAIVVWPLLLSGTGTLRKLQFEAPKLPDVSETDLMLLTAELDRLDDPRPAHQLQAIGEKRDNLVTMLDRRLDTGELTYSRYLSTAQQVYLAVVSNPREVSVALGSISTIDPDYIDDRLAELQREDGDSTAAETSSLQDRRLLAATQEGKVTYLLAQRLPAAASLV
ncbi:MAG: hypothetical protein ACC726_05265 [Chloroflexota bacterium]